MICANLRKRLPWVVFLALLVYYIILVFLSEGTVGGADDLNHYRYARYAFSQPHFFVYHWGKPLFTTLAAPFAQFGFNGVRLFNVICGLLAAYFTFRISRHLCFDMPLVSVFLVAFSPLYAVMMLTGMTEILFSLVLVLSIFLFLKERFFLSAILLSFLPFARTEGIVILPLFALALAWRGKWTAIPLLLSGFVFYSLAGYLHYHDILWVIHEMPYKGGKELYGSGELLHYVKASKYIFGIPLVVLMGAGILVSLWKAARGNKTERRSVTEEWLVVYAPFLVYFAAHSYVWWKGTGNSVGLIRVMAAIIPSAALLGMKGLNGILSLLPEKKWLTYGLGTALAITVCLMPHRMYSLPVPPGPTQQLVKEASEWLMASPYAGKKLYYYDPFFWFFMKLNPYDASKVHGLVPDRGHPEKGISEGEIVLWDAHFSPNEGHLPLERMMNNPSFRLLKFFRPETPFQVLGGYDYAIYLFQRSSPDSLRDNYRILEEMSFVEENIHEWQILMPEEFETTSIGESRPDKPSRSGNHSLEVGPEKEFTVLLCKETGEISSEQNIELHILVYVFFQENVSLPGKVYLVTSLDHRKKTCRYASIDIGKEYRDVNGWQPVEMRVKLRGIRSGKNILKVYVWNKGKQSLWLDDIKVSFTEIS